MSYGTLQIEKMTTESGYSLGAGNASSFKNRLINGRMEIDQRNAGASVSNNGNAASFAVDRTQYSTNFTPTGTAQRSTDAPAGFTNSLLVTVNSGSLVSTSYGLVLQQIEGVNFDDLAWGTASAKPITMSAWVKVSVAGTYSVFLRNPVAYNRYYVSTVTISSANTWTQVSVSVSGDTTGTWAAGTGAALQIGFNLGCGSGYATATANTWANGTQFATSGSVNMYATSGATFQITGWQVEAGTVATSFDFRDYGRELILCKRYYESMEWLMNSGSSSNRPFYQWTNYFQVAKRASPTMTTNGGTFDTPAGGVTATIDAITTNHFRTYPSNTQVWSSVSYTWYANAEL